MNELFPFCLISSTTIWESQVSSVFFFVNLCNFIYAKHVGKLKANKKSANFMFPSSSSSLVLQTAKESFVYAIFCFWFLFLDMMSSYSNRENIHDTRGGREKTSATTTSSEMLIKLQLLRIVFRTILQSFSDVRLMYEYDE